MTKSKPRDTISKENQKTAVNNQWVSTGKNLSDNRERRDEPGGESSQNNKQL